MNNKKKFKTGDVVRYNGNVYSITSVTLTDTGHAIYNVRCLKNNFPGEPVCSSIGQVAEDKMTLESDWPERSGAASSRKCEISKSAVCAYNVTTYKTSYVHGYEDGAEWADLHPRYISEACEWLEMHHSDYVRWNAQDFELEIDTEKMIEDLKNHLKMNSDEERHQ